MDRSARTSARRASAWLLASLPLLAAPTWAQTPSTPPAAPPSATAQIAPGTPSTPPTVPPDQLLNVRNPLPGLRTGGVPPSVEVFAKLAREGFVTFVDLRPEPELSAAARAAAEAAGMTYVQIPVGSDVDLDLGSARVLDAILDDPAKAPLVLACGSGNRSGAMLAVRAYWLDGKSAEEALALGKAGGLTKLEPSVRTLLGLAPLPPVTPAN